MGLFLRRTFGVSVVMACALGARAQVFVVGEKTATDGINTGFKPTHVELPDRPMTERGRRELLRDLEDEQGFAHRILPLGTTLTLQANGKMTPGDEAFKMAVYKKGQAAAPGDRVVITAMEVKADRIVLDINGGPNVPHRFMRHIQISVGGASSAPPDLGEQATGMRVNLMFEGKLPEVSAPEVKALLEPIIDFGAKTSEVAYAETLPTPIKSAVESHEVLVGMNRRMVLAALGEPEHKLREGTGDKRYEEWIFGHQPSTVKFVRFEGDRVTQVKIAALGKPMEVHGADELDGYRAPTPVHTIALGDADDESKQKAGPPSLQLPGEKLPENPNAQANHKVQFPDEKEKVKPIPPVPTGNESMGPALPPEAGPGIKPPMPPSLPGTPMTPTVGPPPPA